MMYNILSYFFLLLYLLSFNQTGEILKENLVIKNDRISTSTSNLQIEVDGTGQIFVADKDQNAIWVFAEDGSVKKKVSRSGRGPGEFTHLGDIFLDEKGILYGLDGSLSKIDLFSSPSYTPSGQILIQPQAGYSKQDINIPEANYYLVTFSPLKTLRNPDQGENLLCRINKEGAVLDTVLTYPEDQMFVYTRGDKIATLDVPFGFETDIELGPNGNIYVGKTNSNYIQRYTKKGTRNGKLKISHHAVPVPERVLAKYRKIASSNQRGSQIFDELLNTGVIPDNRPVYDWFVVDDKKRAWVAVNII